MSTLIDYYHFPLSPWSYLAIHRFNEIVTRHNARVNYKPIAVMLTFDKMGGLPPAKRHPSRQRLRMDELKRWSTFLNIPMNLQPAFFPADASMGSKLIIAAGNQGHNAGALSDAILTAVWHQEKNIADLDTLVEIADSCGLEGSKLLELATSEALETQFAAITDEAHERDVFGSPTYVVNGENFWGQDRLEFLDRALS